MNLCRGICIRYKAVGYEGRIRYQNGQKRCPKCGIFMIYDDVRCPCCKCILRITPRTNKCRKEFHKRKNDFRH